MIKTILASAVVGSFVLASQSFAAPLTVKICNQTKYSYSVAESSSGITNAAEIRGDVQQTPAPCAVFTNLKTQDKEDQLKLAFNAHGIDKNNAALYTNKEGAVSSVTEGSYYADNHTWTIVLK